MKTIRSLIAFFIAPLMAAALLTAHAADPAIEAAKAQGIVGEKIDGYLGIVDAGKANADIQRRVSENNAKRLELYTQLSKQQNQPVAVVAQITGEKQIAGTPSGQMVMTASGSWSKK
jgi:uncharacterized protein